MELGQKPKCKRNMAMSKYPTAVCDVVLSFPDGSGIGALYYLFTFLVQFTLNNHFKFTNIK